MYAALPSVFVLHTGLLGYYEGKSIQRQPSPSSGPHARIWDSHHPPMQAYVCDALKVGGARLC